jgi:hypothetical protein
MVKGLDIFRERFRGYSDRYMLIGGAACDLAMSEAGLEFRATKDLDIVLCVEALDVAFVEAFWAFVREGQYEIQQRAEGPRQFYRFQKPKVATFPFMLELFSRSPDNLPIAQGSHLTPIPTAEEVSSLSAILMDDDYYGFIRSTTQEIDGLPVVGPAGLIPLKARAWLDLTERKAKGESIDSKDIKKHKNDVFRLYQIIDPESELTVPGKVKTDMSTFVTRVASEGVDLKALGMRTAGLESILAGLRKLYRVD